MADTSAKGVGSRLRARRKKLGLSQPKLAKILGVPQQTIAGWEIGAAKRPRMLIEAAAALCTTPEWLLRQEGPEEVVPTIPKEQLASTVESLDPRLIPAVLEFIRNLSAKGSEAA